MRSIRNPEWGRQLQHINDQFVGELARVLEEILVAAGRQACRDMRPLTQAVIGVVMRVACIMGLQGKAAADQNITPTAAATGEYILDMLYRASVPA